METKHVVWLIAGAAVAAGVYYWWNSQKTVSVKPSAVPIPTSNPTVPSMPIPTSDPATYQAAPYNMAFASPFLQTRDMNPR